jgi:hypothetical protein
VTIFFGGLFGDSLSNKYWSQKKWKNKQNWVFFGGGGGRGSVNFKNLEKYATLSIPKNILAKFWAQVTKPFGKFWI